MAPALGLGALLALLGVLAVSGGQPEVLHSLRYLHVGVTEPSPGIPQYMALGYVDGIPFTRYDSERGRVEPQTPWMAAGAEPGYWDGQTQINEENQLVAAHNLGVGRDRYNWSGGFHVWQWVSGCDLLSDGSVRGSYWQGYDGRDFMSFELGSRSFVAADGAAQITKRKWEHDGIEVERWTNYLGNICPEWLRKYVGYGREALERKDPPDVHVSGKEEHGILTLSCHAYGFYPGMIGINWLKGDELRDQETEWGGIVPNSDGTFHSWARIEALPGEREQYRCRVEHAGMPEPGIFAWEPESIWNSIPVLVAVSVIAAIIIIIGLVGVGVWKLRSGKREGNGYDPTPTTGIKV
ncbi:class I histocompatibility antigen, F10 alpha chain-like isoform X2 [Chiroxiphia lanceolata]|uniref:class I histocompatibility antigen, F10 alpha chain-like isoform X1 n=1 Tax=Chiroxiphia lanceolata TaxID=296741 RepID=UPI0013CEFE0F|nr:class I histocompatibility antigen, F10 alpha chain-like isoform X1 [Chiroxiphia lanceolata]XP_032532993.1 class I histocompatibility antigen, F10 alpha chain-like isoform X2 [Chiroxiphia lanceolata]